MCHNWKMIGSLQDTDIIRLEVLFSFRHPEPLTGRIQDYVMAARGTVNYCV